MCYTSGWVHPPTEFRQNRSTGSGSFWHFLFFPFPVCPQGRRQFGHFFKMFKCGLHAPHFEGMLMLNFMAHIFLNFQQEMDILALPVLPFPVTL